MFRPLLALSSVFLGASLMLGCEPGNQTSEPVVPVSVNGKVPSCCEEPTPSIADARKAAINAGAQAPSKTQGAGEAEKKNDEVSAVTAASERPKLSTDFAMTDQEGQPFALKNIIGKPTAATFIFTRCGDPNMCPLQGVKMANLQKQLEKAGLSDKVNLLVFTFDPGYDTPARLKEWGATQGIELTNAKLLRPDPREFADFQYEYQFRAGAVEGQITHKTDMMLIDHEGKLAAFYHGMWDDKQVLANVKDLIAAAK